MTKRGAPRGWSTSIEKALRGEIKLPDVVAKRAPAKGRLRAFAIEPEVTINNQWSQRYTVVEVTGLDRPGLLYELTTTLSKLNLNIASAHVATFGERVVDVFYVTDLLGAQITAPTRQAAIKRPLLALFTLPGSETNATAQPISRSRRGSNRPLNRVLYRRSAHDFAGDGTWRGKERAASVRAIGARLELRLRPQDRTGGPPSGRSDGSRRRRDDFAPREVRKRRRSGGRRSALGSLIYWGAVLAVWALIAAIGLVIWIGAHLPPIQSLEIPKRPPSVLILGAGGATLATRGDMGGAAVTLRELPDYVPKAFIAIEDRRFYSHHGVDPLGILRALMHDVHPPRQRAGRIDHHPAAGKKSVPHPGAHGLAQAAGSCARRSGSNTASPKRRSSSFI